MAGAANSLARVLVGLGATAIVAALSGCSGNAPTNGDPGARPLPPGQTCQSIRAELNKLDSKGVPSQIEASQAGKKLSPAQQSEVDLYNKLLGDYLGARCHTPPAQPAR